MSAADSPCTLAVDFGTSNSAAAILRDGVPVRLPIEPGADALPTAVFFPSDGGPMRLGADAARALIEGDEGRYMRALKSVLGTPLFHEPRRLGGRRRTLADVVTAFLAETRARAERASGLRFERALSGRPVRFHPDPARDARAEADLRACYLAAGFREVAFLFEPEAAALATHGHGREGEAGLVVDIGGGTSDFSAFRIEGGRPRILASHGIRLGGTDFDQSVSLTHVMPLLGLGGELREPMSGALNPVPNAIFVELATWAKIAFLYTPETEREVARMARDSTDPTRMTRLARAIDRQAGHEIAFAVEAGKIAANAPLAASAPASGNGAAIDLSMLERGLAAPIDAASLDAALVACRADLRAAMDETLARAGLAPAEIATAILVGGSSLMGLVAETARQACPAARIDRSDAFCAVVDGLALAAA